ncbi:MAG TPA: ATP-binding protein [Chitinophagaceae bacterium]|nr:ATP-binding protein [Chitinophagaceae bacterium]
MLKVAIIGPESTGKSTLCRQLAEHYQTLWVPEYARAYLQEHGKSYNYDSLLEIAKGQWALEREYEEKIKVGEPALNIQHPAILFSDTEMYVMKVWAEFVFGKCHHWIIDKAVEQHYDLYLLCNIDLAWTYDVLREYPAPEPRQRLFRMYKDILINQPVPWAIISGDYQQRLSESITAVDRIL